MVHEHVQGHAHEQSIPLRFEFFSEQLERFRHSCFYRFDRDTEHFGDFSVLQTFEFVHGENVSLRLRHIMKCVVNVLPKSVVIRGFWL